MTLYTGGCLCGALRYEAKGEPHGMGLCFCRDCRKASGGGFIPFMNFEARLLSITGQAQQSRAKAFRGGDAVRNTCAVCSSLVYGGLRGLDDEHTIYAGSLDDPSLFIPTIAIFARDRPAWALMPPGLAVFDTMPGL